MREIKFRGKSLYNDIWLIGFYSKSPKGTTYITPFRVGAPNKVDPDTIGQYTGLKDKNSVEIYEGDIVDTKHEKYIVAFNLDRCGYYPFATDDGCGCCSKDLTWPNDCRVIGNIHDNPELLEVAR